MTYFTSSPYLQVSLWSVPHGACNCQPSQVTCVVWELQFLEATQCEPLCPDCKNSLTDKRYGLFQNILSFFAFLQQFSHIAIWGSIGLWVVFFIIYSSLWPLIPLAPDMSGEVSTHASQQALAQHVHTSTQEAEMFWAVSLFSDSDLIC